MVPCLRLQEPEYKLGGLPRQPSIYKLRLREEGAHLRTLSGGPSWNPNLEPQAKSDAEEFALCYSESPQLFSVD